MLRILIAIAAGVIASLLLWFRDIPEALFLAILLPCVLFVVLGFTTGLVAPMLGSLLNARRKVRRARETGRLYPARIDSVRRTGVEVNDQPEVMAGVLVGAYPEALFRSTAKGVIDVLDAHRFQPGAIVMVAWPDARNAGTLLIEDPPAPEDVDRFDMAVAGLQQSELPEPEPQGSWFVAPFPRNRGGGPIRTVVYLLTFAVGMLGTPFLVEAAVPLVGEESMIAAGAESGDGDGDGDGDRVDDTGDDMGDEDDAGAEPANSLVGDETAAELESSPVLSSEGLTLALDLIEEEVGTDEMFELIIYDEYIIATVPIEHGSDKADRIDFRDGEITGREPAPIQPRDPAEERFVRGDIDWDAMLALIAQAEELGADHGVDDPEFTHLIVRSTIFTDGVAARMFVNGPYNGLSVDANPDGTINEVLVN